MQTNTKITAAQVKVLAAKLGISDVGICSADEKTDLLRHLPEGKTPFVVKAEKRIAPSLVLSGAKSIIMCAFHYGNTLQGKGNLSCYTQIKDYHIVVKEYLARLLLKIQSLDENAEGYIFTDSSPLCDKALAYEAGLGYFGKNSLLIHPKFGSLFFIGGIVTNIELKCDEPVAGSCGDCRACTDACPVHLCGTGSLDGYKCISYLQQKKGTLTPEEEDLIRKSGSVWGCDICINACPKNRNTPSAVLPEFAHPNPCLPQDLTQEEFEANYNDRAFSWRGYETIRRNLDIFK